MIELKKEETPQDNLEDAIKEATDELNFYQKYAMSKLVVSAADVLLVRAVH
jgi:hypothetical protein